MNSDFKDLLSAFAKAEVRYLIIGGYAVSKHSEPRYTKDLDIWIDNSKENAERVFSALKSFGAPLHDVSVDDFSVPTLVYQIGIEPSRIDILMGLTDMSFEECWQRRETASVAEIPIEFISLNDLIDNKMRAGRPQDLIDVEKLQKKVGDTSSIIPGTVDAVGRV